MYRHIEDYVARLLFEIPLPLNNTKLKLYLPPGNILPDNILHSNLYETNPNHVVVIY